jgi:hypothetical protein
MDLPKICGDGYTCKRVQRAGKPCSMVLLPQFFRGMRNTGEEENESTQMALEETEMAEVLLNAPIYMCRIK